MNQKRYNSKTSRQPFWKNHRSTLAFINWKEGLLGGIFMGTLVWLINMATTHPPDLIGSSIAAGKQCLYTLLVGGFIVRLSEVIALADGIAWVRVMAATIFPTAVASIFVYGVHILKGTPSPFLSTLPVLFVSLIGLPIIATNKRKKWLAIVNKS